MKVCAACIFILRIPRYLAFIFPTTALLLVGRLPALNACHAHFPVCLFLLCDLYLPPGWTGSYTMPFSAHTPGCLPAVLHATCHQKALTLPNFPSTPSATPPSFYLPTFPPSLLCLFTACLLCHSHAFPQHAAGCAAFMHGCFSLLTPLPHPFLLHHTPYPSAHWLPWHSCLSPLTLLSALKLQLS